MLPKQIQCYRHRDQWWNSLWTYNGWIVSLVQQSLVLVMNKFQYWQIVNLITSIHYL